MVIEAGEEDIVWGKALYRVKDDDVMKPRPDGDMSSANARLLYYLAFFILWPSLFVNPTYEVPSRDSPFLT